MKKGILQLGLRLSFTLAVVLVLSFGPAAVAGEQAVVEPQYGGTLTILPAESSAGNQDVSSADKVEFGGAGAWWQMEPVVDYLLMGDFEKYGPRGTGEFDFPTTSIQDIPDRFRKGALAESWEVTPNRIVFHLRHGVILAAYGTEYLMKPRELIAEDVVFNLQRYWDTLTPWAWTKNGGFIKCIYAKDRYTVVTETTSYNFAWEWLFSAWASAIYAPESVEAGLQWKNLVGTGPYMFKEYVSGSYYSFVKNPTYWGSATINDRVYDDVPFVDTLDYPIIQDMSTRIAALQTGKVDIAQDLPVMYESILARSNPELEKKENLSTYTELLSLRCDIPPFNNKEVRRAMMVALDLPAINKALFTKGEYYAFPMAPQTAIYTPLEELPASSRDLWEYNPEKAREMLADAGYPNGFKVTGIASDGTELELVKSYWQAIGVELDIEIYDQVTLQSYISARKDSWQVVPTNTMNLYPEGPVSKYLTSRIPPHDWWNTSSYSNKYIDDMYGKAIATVDLTERNAIWKELYLLMVDEVAYIPIGAPYVLTYWWPWVKNYYGEFGIGQNTPSPAWAAIWIDQELKAKMGH